MADKEIIIGGVDVKKCKHFKALYESRPDGFGGITIENYCYLYEDNCEKYPQCLYRSNRLQQLETQLKRKEQECENWKETAKQYAKNEEYYRSQVDQLKAKNETYKKMLDNPEVQIALTDIRTGERDLWQKYKPRMEQAEQKLKRIEEYCEEQNLKADYTACDILQIIEGEGNE